MTDINVHRTIINTISVIVHCCDLILLKDWLGTISLTVKVLLFITIGRIFGLKGN
jgi:hypothetical protein